MSTKVVIAHHPYEAQREDEISFDKDEIIKVTDFSDPDWWVGKKKDGSLGFFPSNFVSEKEETVEETVKQQEEDEKEKSQEEPAEQQEEEENASVEQKKDQVIGMARVMEDYAMSETGEISLHRGGIINVYEVIDDEWSRGELNGKVGRYPSKYVEDIDMPGRPDISKQSSSTDIQHTAGEDENAPKGGFKLAAFGVKQGGIGSLLAGGFPGLKKTGNKASATAGEEQKPKEEASTEPAVVEEPKKVEEVETSQEQPQLVDSPVPVQQKEEEEQKPLGKAIVLHPYDAESEDELSLLRGEYVEILDRNVDEGWWKGVNERGQSGVFPNNFVREIDEESIAPPTPTRARRSVQSVNSSTSSAAPSPVPDNRPPSINSMARPPQVPRPASVQTPTTARPISVQPVAQRPSSISHTTGSTSVAAPPRVPTATVAAAAAAQVTSPTTIITEEPKEEEQKDIQDNQEDVASPVGIVEKVQSLPTAPERKASVVSEDSSIVSPPPPTTVERKALSQESIQSPPVIKEDPISDLEEKESGTEEMASPSPMTTPIAATRDIKSVDMMTPVAATRDIKEEPVEAEHKVKEEESQASPKDSAVVMEEEKKDVIEKEVKKDEIVKEEEDEFKDATEEHTDEKSAEEDPVIPAVEEKKELDIIPTSGPKLITPARARIGGGRARRSPAAAATSSEPSQTEILQKEILEQKEEPKEQVQEEEKEAPPAKPVKPIFAKFPTPFVTGSAISKTHLKPTQTRKLWDEKPEEKAPTVEDNNDEPVRPSGVKNIASRFNFAGNNTSGGNEVLETKLKNHTKNEVEKVRKEFEQLLNEEREKRVALEEIVQQLLEKVKSFEEGQ